MSRGYVVLTTVFTWGFLKQFEELALAVDAEFLVGGGSAAVHGARGDVKQVADLRPCVALCRERENLGLQVSDAL